MLFCRLLPCLRLLLLLSVAVTFHLAYPCCSLSQTPVEPSEDLELFSRSLAESSWKWCVSIWLVSQQLGGEKEVD